MSKYMEAVQVHSSYAPAYYNIAVIYSELNIYQEVPRLVPTRCAKRQAIAGLTSSFSQALQYYNAAIQHNKFYAEAYCNVGVIYKNVGQLEAAITFYEKVATYFPISLLCSSSPQSSLRLPPPRH